MTWNDLPPISEAMHLDSTDEQCLDEIKATLEKHSKTGRFGVTLLHQHFALADDELLVEHCDYKHRTLTTTPQKALHVFERGYTPTVWRFDGHKPHACGYCPTTEDHEGRSQHAGYKEPC